jgi:putative ABC transport system ATP-binding protein/lipoprotein-releasing system ATP-binding protein
MGIIGKNIIKEFGDPPNRVLHGFDLEIKDGEFVSISGRSGSGKSTLLYLISTLDNPTQGTIEIDGHVTASMDDKEMHYFRNTKVGFIFQFHFLLPELTALENILLGPRNLGLHKEKEEEAYHLMKRLEIEEQAKKLPSQMSGGQQQRVAIARALILKPKYIFADEPTGNLDSVSGQRVMEILKDINQNHHTTIALVTHEPDYAAMAEREIYLVDGQISSRN